MLKWSWIYIGLLVIFGCDQQKEFTVPNEENLINYKDSLFDYKLGLRNPEKIGKIRLDEKDVQSFIEEKININRFGI